MEMSVWYRRGREEHTNSKDFTSHRAGGGVEADIAKGGDRVVICRGESWETKKRALSKVESNRKPVNDHSKYCKHLPSVQ